MSQTDLRNRLLLWHKVLSQITGSISLSYGKDGLSKTALADWSSRLRIAANDIDDVRTGRSSSLDAGTSQVLKSAGSTVSLVAEGGQYVDQADQERPDNKGPVTSAKVVGPIRILKKATRKPK